MLKYLFHFFLLVIFSGLLFSCSNNSETAKSNEFNILVDSLRIHSEEIGKDSAFYLIVNRADSTYQNYLLNNTLDSSSILSAYILIEEKSEASPKEAMQDLFELSVLAKEMNLIKIYGLILNTRATLLYDFGLYNEAIPLYLESAKIIKANNDMKAYAYSLLDIGNIYFQQREYEVARDYYDLAKDEFLKFENAKDMHYGLAVYENNLALIEVEIPNYNQAEIHFRNGLSERMKAGKEKLYSNSYYFLARTKEALGQFDSVGYYYQKAMQVDSSLNLVTELIASTLNYSRYIAHQVGDEEKAFGYYKKILALSQKYQIHQYIGSIHLGMAGYYSRKGEKDTAIHYALIADSLTKLHSQSHANGSVLRFLRDVYTDKEDYYNVSLILREIIANTKESNNSNEVLKTQIAYEYEQKKQEKILREEDKIRHRIVNSLIGTIALLFLLYAILLIRSRKKINLQSKKLEKSLKAEKRLKLFQQDMTNMIIHDLKNPLSTIINVKLLAEDEHGLNLVQQSGYQMDNLVMNILDVYKYDNSKINLKLEESAINDIISSSLSQIIFLANQKGISIVFDRSINCIINLDREIIIRVLVNLLSNAIKYSPKNSDININLQDQNNSEIKISIINRGPSIAKEFQKQIFERFVHSEDNNTTSIRSTGIGLTYCKLAIEAHKGLIGVNSEPDKNVEFWFTLPGLQEFTKINNKELLKKGNSIYLSNDDIAYLKEFANKLSRLELFHISEINSCLSEIELKNNNIKKWVEELNKALGNMNDKKYNNLLDLVLA